MRRPRLRVWWLMVAVLGVSLALWFAVIERRRAAFKAKAEFFASEQSWDGVVVFVSWTPEALQDGSAAQWYKDYTKHFDVRWMKYHAVMRRKYERAARYPWLSVAPDPPELLPAVMPTDAFNKSFEYQKTGR